jgi:uncharacterized membrane protein YjfL (UPF0719 family)
MAQQIFIQLAVALVRVLAAIILSAGALYSGINLFDRLTSGIEEWKELKKGNLAIGLLLSAVMVSLVLLMESRISEFIYAIRADLDPLTLVALLLFTLLNYVLGIIAGIVLIFLTIHTIDRITPDVDETQELRKGNLAVALLLSAALILVVLAARPPLESAFGILKSLELGLLGYA